MIELLAPAKNKDVAISAINCGADAIYIGATDFGARKKAANSLSDIAEVVYYAHKYWVKVYVTLNTILTDEEIEDAVNLVKQLNKIGIDGLIIQDLGLLYRLIELKLPIHIHMSTQCDNSTIEKIAFFNKIGVSRVVLARETSIEQMKKIHSQFPNLELENFIHGALCVSYSGQCYLSQYIGGRSANRGECAQPCRKKYTVETTDGKIIKKDIYALCLKDFNASNCLTEMIDAGITSFKIEGRLKDENYVKNIVAYYNLLLKDEKRSSSGQSLYSFTPNPEKSFNRGFTEYFLKGRANCFAFDSPKSKGEYIGKIIEIRNKSYKIDTNKTLHIQDGLCFGDKGFLINKIEKGYIYPNRYMKLEIGTKIYRNFDSEFEKQLTQPVKRKIAVHIIYENNIIKVIDENNVTIEEALNITEIALNQEKIKENFVKQFSKSGESIFCVKECKILSKLPFLPISKINELRREIFKKLENKRAEVYSKNKQPQKKMNFAQYYLSKIDYKANVHNSFAKEFYTKCGCEVTEPSFETRTPQRQVALMKCKYCIKHALNMCKSPVNLLLRDDHHNTYLLNCDCKNCEMSILNLKTTL